MVSPAAPQSASLRGFSAATPMPDPHLRCLTLLTPTGEIPGIGKSPTLFRLDRLEPAIDPVKPDAGPIRVLQQRKTRPTTVQPGVVLHKLVFRHSQVPREDRHLPIRHLDLARPSTTVGTPLALVADAHRIGHRKKWQQWPVWVNAKPTSSKTICHSPTPYLFAIKTCRRTGIPPESSRVQ